MPVQSATTDDTLTATTTTEDDETETTESDENAESTDTEDAPGGGGTSVFVGEEFTLELESNPSTGYAWYVAEMDEDLIGLVSQTYPPPLEDLPGAPGTERFIFVAVGPGIGHLLLHYGRPWDPDGEPANIHRMELVIIE